MKRGLKLMLSAVILALTACGGGRVPEHFKALDVPPMVYPDYAGVTIPVNMAPLTMELLSKANDAVIRYSAADCEIVCGGLKARPAVDEWHTLAAKARGQAISVEVYAENDGQWVRFKPFTIHVSPDSIDAWLSYRLISPSFVSYEELTINQRCLETFDEEVIADNMLCSTETGGQCINCHSYQQHNPARMQLHARQTHGGTIIAYDGGVEKVNLANSADTTSLPGVYPAWHPWLKLIAYSTNKTMQSFHTANLNKIEVLDSESDLIAYDVDSHEVMAIESRPDELETFPAWSPDGRWLYYCSAHFVYHDRHADQEEITLRHQEVRYNIYRKAFNPQTRQFGERELVVAADTLGMSATLPRISPDGRWLMFTMGKWGCFHIWHHDADLWMLDLSDGEGSPHPLAAANSDDTESYHAWSSNSRWVVFSSRRYDGVFTRPFIAHIDAQGQASKPFELPARDPDHHRQLLKSYNVPELMRGRVALTPQQLAAKLKEDGKPVRYTKSPK